MAAQRVGGAPTEWVLPGRPWLEVQGFGVGSRFCSVSPRVPPHRVRLPGENVDGAGAGPRAPPPSGDLIGGSLRQKGGAASPPRRTPSAGDGYNVTLTTVLLFATFRSKIPLPVPTMPCALKGPQTTQGGWLGRGRLKGQRGTLDALFPSFPALLQGMYGEGHHQIKGEALWMGRDPF